MQHVAKVLACLDPDSASAEEWDELLHAQATWVYTTMFWDRIHEGIGPGIPFFSRPIDPQEAMERAVVLGLLPPEFIDGGRHFFNTASERMCNCDVFMDAGLLCHNVSCRLMKRGRMAYVEGRTLTSEAQVFQTLMHAREILAADRFFSGARRILWCPRYALTGMKRHAGADLWFKDLGEGLVAISLPAVSFDSRDPGPYTPLEIGRRVHEAAQAELAAIPTFS